MARLRRFAGWCASWFSLRRLAEDMERFDREYAIYSAARARGMSRKEAFALLDVLDG